MSNPTEREMRVLRLLHAGMKLVSHGTGTGHLEMTGCETVRPSNIDQMCAAGWIVMEGNQWKLTEKGREMTYVKDDVARFSIERRTA